MAERGFGEPSRLSDAEVFDAMEAQAEERMYRESKLFAIASLMLIFSIALVGVAIVVTVVRG
jgi:hypothetical protein